MKPKYFIILIMLFGTFISCNNDVNKTVNKKPCVKTGVYCRGTKLYTCHNDFNNEGVEEILEECDNGQICSNQECITATCDEIINCVDGERRCNDDNSYKICGNYDSDTCLEWDIRNCGENLICNNGLCVLSEENPCNLIDCQEHSSCKVNVSNKAECICDPGYELNSNNLCVPGCTPDCDGKVCGDDGCDGSCGTCADGTCNANGQCETICTPNCDGNECGDDGCGGSCGTCQQLGTHCFENQCVSDCENPNPCTEENRNICEMIGNAIQCKCNNGFHLSDNACIKDIVDDCTNVSCGAMQHCDSTNGDCVDNTKMVNCNIVTPMNGITDNENLQVEITWSDGNWSSPEDCPWHCNDGYYESGNECLAITCAANQHLEDNTCVSNEKTVPCNEIDYGIDNAHNDVKDVTITWNNGWQEIPDCEWICDDEYHEYTDPNSLISFCVSDTQVVNCQVSEDLPDNAIEETGVTVTQTWIYDDENSDEGYWYTPYCEWHCDETNSCLSSDETSCITKENIDECDGEDNNCDGVVDNLANGPENSSCNVGNFCFGRVYNGHHYIFCNALLKKWSEAEANCVSRNAHLVSIDSEDENEFIEENIDDRYWIGYYQNENGGSAPWYWSNNSTSTYTNWNDGEPNNYCLEKEWSWSKFKNVCVKWENCAETYSDGNWNDADCDSSRRFICEKPLP